VFELERVRSRKLPPASVAIGALTLVLYGIEILRSGSTSPDVEHLMELGASEQRAIWNQHELWRLLCPAFLHASVVHIALNGYSFAALAPFVERIWGSARFLVVYVVAAIAGCALSSRSSGAVSVGASGALFGLMGFLLAAAYSGAHRHEVRTIVEKTWGQGLLISVGGILLYGFQPGSHIDNMAHLGGLLGGAGLGLLLVETEEADAPTLAMGAGAVLAIVAAWSALLIDRRQEVRFESLCREARVAYEKGDFTRSADLCEQAVALRPREVEPGLFLIESMAYVRAGRFDEARYCLERLWHLDPQPEVAAELILVSLKRGDAKAARSWADECKRAVAGPGGAAFRARLHGLDELQALAPDAETRAAIAAIGS
jgi:rhomboid protease GluP